MAGIVYTYVGHSRPGRNTVEYFYVLLTVHLSIMLGNDQLDTQLIYFTIRLL